MGKARVTVDKRNGNIVVRAYGRKDPATGRVYAPSKSLSKDATQDEIKVACSIVELRAGFARKGVARYTVGDLVNYYNDALVDYGKSPTSEQSYRSIARCYVRPYIGEVPFDQIKPSDFSDLYRKLLRSGSKDGGPLSPRTIQKFHAYLSGCFTTLMEDGIIDRNPVRGINVPRGKSPEAKPLSERDFAALTGWTRDRLAEMVEDDAGWDRRVLAAALWTCLHTGVRRGELAGFRIGDWRPAGAPDPDDPATLRVAVTLVDVKRRGLVRKDPKSASSKRILSLDAETERIVSEHMDVQRLVLADHGVVQDDDTPLFARADGGPFEPSRYTDGFKQLVKTLHLAPDAHLHTLRHTHASYLLEAGVNVKAIQERLGHSTVEITLNKYGHLMPGRDAKTAAKFGEVSETIAQRTHDNGGAVYAPKCPLSGETCARYRDKAGTSHA